MVSQVVADLGPDPGRRVLLGDLEALVGEQAAQPRRGRLELDERAEGVEEDGHDQEIQCQVANCAVNRPSPTAEVAATRSVIRRSSHTRPSHMNIGNSTARTPGSDMSGCGVTGNDSGSASDTATHAPYAFGSRRNVPTQATTAKHSDPNSIRFSAPIR